MNDEPTPLAKGIERLMEHVGAVYTAGDVEDLFEDDAARMGVRTPEELNAARWSKVMPQRFGRASLDDFTDDTVTRPLVEWAEHAGGRNLVLFGAVGTGKTHAAVAACRPAHDRGLHVEFVPAVEMFDMLRPGGTDDALDALLDADRLVIDDLGAERPTDWTAERLYLVVNRRWLDERPTVVTTNLDPKPFECEVGARMFSRIVGSGAVIVRMAGPDLRRRKP